MGLKLHSDIADGYTTVDVGRPMPEVPPVRARRSALGRPPRRPDVRALVDAPRGGGGRRAPGRGAPLRARGRARRRPRRGAARLGILAAGKTYGDVVTALAELGVELGDLAALGIRILKPALVWPLEPTIVRVVRRRAPRDRRRRGEARVPRGAGEVAAVRHRGRAVVTGKRDPERRAPRPLGRRARRHRRRAGAAEPAGAAPRSQRACDRLTPGSSSRPILPARTPYFCSGCPHNRSTVVPEGSVAGGGSDVTAWRCSPEGSRHRDHPDGRRGRAVGGHVAVQQ